jgi:Zn-dependent protease
MKTRRTRLEIGILRRLEAGLPPTRWQQFRLHVQTMWRHGRALNIHKAWYHIKGVCRIVWPPFTLFHICGVPVQMHFTYLIYPVGLLTWWLSSKELGRGLIAMLTILPLLFGSLLAHEIAHVIAARRFGIGTRRVVFVPFGAVAEFDSMLRAPGEFWIALAGPLASFILASMFWWMAEAFREPAIPWRGGYSAFLISGFVVNLTLGAFNLLPCFPMDGGRMLRSLLAVTIRMLFKQHANRAFLVATRIAVRYVAWIVGLGMIALTILVTHLWLHLILFPLLLFVAEAEYWLLRTGDTD